MARRLYMLPFDHRESFATKLFGWSGVLSAEQAAEITVAKRVIYDGFQAAVAGGAPKEHAAILADERFSIDILGDASRQGYMTACPAERSGQTEFIFEFGEEFAHHIEAVNPTFCKVLVRYNPDGNAALNGRQATRLKRLSDYLRSSGRLFMFELLVPPAPSQLERFGTNGLYDQEVRPALMVQAVHELQAAGVEPDVWKVEGMDRREDCVNLVAAARRDGRGKVVCITLGRGEDVRKVRTWLTTAASVSGFVGFAVGRTTFWDALVAWRARRITREAAVEVIADRYREWVDIFEEGVRAAAQSERLLRRALNRWENEGGHV
jgi:myo-inositol catabolism protein IolC